MSLVGSLEDLGLGDILQIINLSGKSGVLVLRADVGEGQISFDNGLIRSAFTLGGATELRDLVGDGSLIPAEALESACQDARSRGLALAPVLRERGLLDEEQLDGLLRENIERAVLAMFRWSAGEFSFEVRDVQETADDLFVSPGVNPQFLALEGTRHADEQAHAPSSEELPATEPLFEPEPELEADPAATLAPDDDGIVEAELIEEDLDVATEAVQSPDDVLDAEAALSDPLLEGEEAVPSESTGVSLAPPPIIFVEPDLAVVLGQPLDYVQAHPTTALLIVEVAEASLPFDRTTKAKLYAEHLIPEYWIVNIGDRQLEVFRNPSTSGYETHKVLRADERVTPLHAPNFSLLLSNLFSSLQ